MSERAKTTLQRIFGSVKQAPRAHAREHFAGGAALFVVVALAFVAAVLAAPRPTTPLILPLPEPHRTRLARVSADDRARAEQARRQGLTYETRAVGEAFRRFGAAVAAGNAEAQPRLDALRALAKSELSAHGADPLLALRALQTELFVTATEQWERTGRASSELSELGGDFVALAERSGWLAGRELSLEPEERALLFRMRWNELTGLAAERPFEPSLDESRARYALLLLRHPSGTNPTERLGRQLGYVKAAAALDPEYPAALAQGVLLFRAEAYAAAADAFRAHLAAHPDGPWTLRAKNHLLAAVSHVPGED